MQTSFPRERVGTYRQAAACELSAARTDAGQKCAQPRDGGEHLPCCGPQGAQWLLSFPPASQLGGRGPRDRGVCHSVTVGGRGLQH